MIISDDGKTVYDHKTNLTWDRAGSNSRMTFAEAGAYAESANSEKHLGFDGWRVPTVAELQSIVDFSEFSPAINSEIFTECQCAGYWTSTTYAPNPASAWIVIFDYGYAVTNVKTYDGYFVRLVRSGQ